MSHDDAARRETLRGSVHVLRDLCTQRTDDEGVDVVGRAEEPGRLSLAEAALGEGPCDPISDQATEEAALVVARDALWLAVADLDNDDEIAKLAGKVSRLVARRLFPHGAP